MYILENNLKLIEFFLRTGFLNHRLGVVSEMTLPDSKLALIYFPEVPLPKESRECMRVPPTKLTPYLYIPYYRGIGTWKIIKPNYCVVDKFILNYIKTLIIKLKK
ncbi:hypothetical protein HZS_463 [Henneguya salminicola]|nr:hypothetical protein HZS_463 [Henneguya salminicola]